MGWVIRFKPVPASLRKTAERLPSENEEIPCSVKKPRRQAGIYTKQGLSVPARVINFEPDRESNEANRGWKRGSA